MILAPNDYGKWLDLDTREPGKLLTPLPASEMVVSRESDCE